MSFLRAALREPLLHFVLIGALLFALTAWRQQQHGNAEIRITSGEIAQLAAFWETQSQRQPSSAELRGLIEERIDEEVLAREAVRLGLDRDDVIVRRRLAQKMAFVSDDLALVTEPAEADLRAYFEAHREAYTTPDLYTLRHVFFNPDRHGMALDTDAQRALRRLTRGADASEVGDPFMLPRELADVSRDDIARDFGSVFAEAVTTSTPGAWAGPVRSPFGVHLVKLESHTPSSVARFEDVRDRVHEAFLAQKQQEANTAQRARLRQQYKIVVETTEGTGS
ncbi:MAG TPA: peptidylprolyl isomerase [Steroidobacteraceae bacterium]|nr:peptidylprolyl isomerase [Steroidobacteraceae bacterium]HJY42466.1 peptidylprolyl isomerase [Steroidobacteraceae bacterium]